MATTTNEVKDYSPSISGTPWGNAYGGITLELSDGNRALLHFVRDGNDLPDNSRTVANNGWTIYSGWFRERAFADVLDILRNEKPVWFNWTELSDGRMASSVSARREPTGEGEDIH
ncbi:MAG: hypothetical protein WBM90_01880 [Acidimicrobiia bacterium]